MPDRFCFSSISNCQPGVAALRSPPDFALSRTRRPSLFAPRPPRTLVSSFRGAKSSQSRRPRPPRHAGGASLCSPLPARPCSSVSGSKIFTFPPPDFAPPHSRRPPLFASLSPRALVPPFRGAKSSHSRRRCVSRHAGTSGGRPRQRKCCRAPPPNRKSTGQCNRCSVLFLSSLSVILIPLLPPARS